MKKKITKNNVTRQPVIKNISLIGTTLMISSSILIPGIQAKAYVDNAAKDQSGTTDSQSQETNTQEQNNIMDLNNFETVSLVKEESNQFDLNLNLTAHSVENKETTIQVSPNVDLVSDTTKSMVVDELGRTIGNYTIDTQLNQIKITFTETGFTQAKLVVSASMKKFDLAEQVVTVSIGESMRSKTIAVEKQEEVVASEEVSEEEVTETTESTEETTEATTESSVEEEPSNTSESEVEVSTETETTSQTEASTAETSKKDTTDEITGVTEDSSTDSSEPNHSTETTASTIEESTEDVKGTTETSETESSTSEAKETSTTEETKEASTTEEAETEDLSNQGVAEASMPMMARTFSALSSKDQFIQDTAYHAQQVASENDLYASVMIAQAILESGYGTSTLSSAPNYNLFGIKGAYNGQSVTMQTWEYFNGQNVVINAQFRKYPSYRESFEDNARVIKTTSFSPGSYFYSGAWKSNTNSYQDATRWLTGKYATDPNYNTKLNNLIVSYNLTQYDSPSSGTGSTGNTNTGSTNKPNNTTNTSTGNNTNNSGNTTTNTNSKTDTYTVKSGDTLYRISNQYGVTIAQLKSWNNLTSDMIYVGQKLKVSKGTTTINTGTNTNTNTNTSTGNSTTNTTKPNTNNNNTTTTTKPNNTTNTNTGSKTSTYTVKSGDTLYAIGLKYGVTVAQLKSWNNLSGDIIYIDQKIKLESNSVVSNKPTTTTNTANTSKPSTNNTNTNNVSTSTSKYTIKSGDTLYGIGLKYGVTVAQLKSWNNLTGDTIYVNQSLVIKNQKNTTQTVQTNAPQTTTTQVTKPNQVTSTSTTNTHTVKSGDSLYRIALNNHVSVNDLKKWNYLTNDLIYVGQKLTIKQGTSTATVPVSVASNSSNYKVKSGDSLYRISLNHGVSVADLKLANNLSGDMIYVSQTLKIPGTTQTKTKQVAKKTGTRHEVKSGDSLWALSNKYSTSISQLKSWNNLASDVIYKGQSLRVG